MAFGAALLHSTTLTAYMVFGKQIWSKWGVAIIGKVFGKK
jgi:hypothetical protein